MNINVIIKNKLKSYVYFLNTNIFWIFETYLVTFFKTILKKNFIKIIFKNKTLSKNSNMIFKFF